VSIRGASNLHSGASGLLAACWHSSLVAHGPNGPVGGIGSGELAIDPMLKRTQECPALTSRQFGPTLTTTHLGPPSLPVTATKRPLLPAYCSPVGSGASRNASGESKPLRPYYESHQPSPQSVTSPVRNPPTARTACSPFVRVSESWSPISSIAAVRIPDLTSRCHRADRVPSQDSAGRLCQMAGVESPTGRPGVPDTAGRRITENLGG
jgi:hypothetical protein